MKSLIRSALAMALVLMSVGVVAAGQNAKFRAVHLSPDAPTVDIVVNDVLRPFEDVSFGDVSEYATVPANLYNVKVTPAGAPAESAVLDGPVNLFYGEQYTVVALDTLENIKPLVLVDDNSPLFFRQSRVRFVHASPNAPRVDIKVADGPFLFQDVGFTEVGDYIVIPDGFYDLEVRVAGTDTVALELPAVLLRKGRTYTVFASGLLGGDPALGVVLSEDSRTNGYSFFNRR